MHYLAAVVVPADTNPENLADRVTDLMQPYDKNAYDNEQGHWDWWSIGGRWTGVWDGYDPTKDPRNCRECWLCQGTGMRNDPAGQEWRREHPDYTCNGCWGGPRPGLMVKHPSEWASNPGDMLPVAAYLDTLDEKRLPHDLLTPDGWLESETWDGSDFHKTPDWEGVVRKALEPHLEQLLVAVDYHS